MKLNVEQHTAIRELGFEVEERNGWVYMTYKGCHIELFPDGGGQVYTSNENDAMDLQELLKIAAVCGVTEE